MLHYCNRNGVEISRRSWTSLLERDGYQSVATTDLGDRLVATTWVGVYDDAEDPAAYAFVTGLYERSPSRMGPGAWWKPAGELILSVSEDDALLAHRRILAVAA